MCQKKKRCVFISEMCMNMKQINVWRVSLMCSIESSHIRSYTWHAAFLSVPSYAASLSIPSYIHTCDMPNPYVWQAVPLSVYCIFISAFLHTFIQMKCLIHMCGILYLHQCLPSYIHTCDMPHSYAWQAVFLSVTSYIHTCDMPNS